MRFRTGGAVLAALLAFSVLASPVQGQTVIVTPSNLQGWQSATYYGPTGTDPGTGAFSGITTTYPDLGLGSVEISLQDEGNSEADWYYDFTATPLSTLSALSFDWWTSSSSTTPDFTSPAFALGMSDGHYFVWEAAYNGYSGGVPMDQWNSSDILNGTFWYTGSGTGDCGYANAYETLAQFNTDCYGGTGQVTELDPFLGYGYPGTQYDGAVDNIAYGFNSEAPTVFNFEPDQAVTPEPGTLSLLAMGLAGLGGAGIRKRRATNRA